MEYRRRARDHDRGLVDVAYVVMLLYYAFLDPKTRDITGKKALIFVVFWVIGIAWYYFWKRRSARWASMSA